ncbi:MAG: DUF1249 domain-containing protein [Chromatiales bacterium]|nr:DUF1249 domain-containing protein [Chromatiales bacterium]
MSHTICHSSPRSPMWVFEENYRLWQRLLPELEQGGNRYLLSGHDGEEMEVLLLEQCPYTTMVELSKPFTIDGEWLPDLSMQLRIYHDARVIEVSAYQGCRHIPARYQVTSHGRHHRDEKRQINFLLHDLLRYCVRLGYCEQREVI